MAQFHTEHGAVYYDQDLLIICQVQANFENEMALCQSPSGFALAILERGKELVSVDLGGTKIEAVAGLREFIKKARAKASDRTIHHCTNIRGEEVLMSVYPVEDCKLSSKVYLYCPTENIGAGIILLNNLPYLCKVLEEFPSVRFKKN